MIKNANNSKNALSDRPGKARNKEGAFFLRLSENEEMDSVKVTGKKTTGKAQRPLSHGGLLRTPTDLWILDCNGEGASLRNSLSLGSLISRNVVPLTT